jgi:hypothetical protein
MEAHQWLIEDSSATSDTFITSRYAELVENQYVLLNLTTLHLQCRWNGYFY